MRDDLSRPGGKDTAPKGCEKTDDKIKIRLCEGVDPNHTTSARGAFLPEARLQGCKNSSVQGHEISP